MKYAARMLLGIGGPGAVSHHLRLLIARLQYLLGWRTPPRNIFSVEDRRAKLPRRMDASWTGMAHWALGTGNGLVGWVRTGKTKTC
jgi:hypothetical protein